MAREESYIRLNESIEYPGKSIDVVREIYDDFESRTCENCKYSFETDLKDKDTLWCEHEVSISTEALEEYVKKDFGCNKWEAKTVSTDTKGEEDE